MARLHTPDQFKSRPALLLMGVAGLVLAYLIITRAFQTGSYWQYLGFLILMVLSIRLIIRSLKPKK